MKIIIQRVREASVCIDGEIVGAIRQGYVLLVGVTHDDTVDDVNYAVRKISQMRIFSDSDGKMNLSLQDVAGSILSISQFTLFADTKKGNRPSFVQAATPELAKKMYELLNTQLKELGIYVETGRFGADMQVSLINDGPVTIVLDTKHK